MEVVLETGQPTGHTPYKHLPVNHSMNVVDPTRNAGTNCVENMWVMAKSKIPAGSGPSTLYWDIWDFCAKFPKSFLGGLVDILCKRAAKQCLLKKGMWAQSQRASQGHSKN